jgi:predicted AlkP superfamily pyrophosphatase or phosphodiesterase
LPSNGKKLILALVDGLTPSMLEAAVGTEEAPALTLIAENAHYTRAVSVFPSLTPVCVSSIMTGAYPDAHRIPHLVWYPPRAAAPGGVRLVLRRDPGRGHAPVHPRRDPEHER